MIIGSCIGEDQYYKISFLEPDDFQDKECREFFRLIVSCQAKENILLNLLAKEENLGLRTALSSKVYMVACVRLESFALKVLERRFASTLNKLGVLLSGESKNPLEVELLTELSGVTHTADIFDLSEGILDYLGSQASDFTTMKINAYLRWMNGRIAETKKVINGNK